jgi:hypothetical protein
MKTNASYHILRTRMFTVLPWPSLPYGAEELPHTVVFVMTSVKRTARTEDG